MSGPAPIISHGRTESGDALPMLSWHTRPNRMALLDAYALLVPDEFEAFGEDFMAELIEVTEAPWA